MRPSSRQTIRLPGSRVGHIRVLELLGRGGMGEIYVGFDETLERRVALKAIGARHRLSAQSRARFLREARILSRLEHPNICRIYDYIEDEGSDFLVLELIAGGNLAEALATGLEPAMKMKVAIQIAQVLEAAHGQGVVHRDLKPQNVMVTPEGEAKVLDFGLARPETPMADEASEAAAGEGAEQVPAPAGAPVDRGSALPADSLSDTELIPPAGDSGSLETRHGAIVGTPIYMSPEQASGEAVTTASDMYSFGLLLQTLFSGRSPYPEGIDPPAILARAGEADTLPFAGHDKDLVALVARLKSRAPAARPTAATALERLRWIRDKPRRRLRRLVAAGVLLVVAVAGAKYTYDLKTARDAAERRRSQAEDLIGFMIGDLRGKLAPVNRLEVLDDIGEKALEYFAAVPPAELSEDELLFRSRTLSQIGQVRMDQGDLTAAMAVFEESLTLARGLVERDPSRAEWQAWLGAAHFWVGSVFWQRGEPEAALASFRDYLAVSRELVAGDPDNLDWQLELSYAHSNIASVLEFQGEVERAIEAFRASLDIKQRLVERRPDNRQWRAELAGSHSWLGEALVAQGDLSEALDHRRANLRLLEELAIREPTNSRWRWLLGIAHEKLGDSFEMLGRLDDAAAEFEAYRARNLELVDGDPGNSTWQRELAVSHLRLGELAMVEGDHRRSLEQLEAAMALLQDLVERDPSNSGWRRELARSQAGLARVLPLGRDRREALDSALAAIDSTGEREDKTVAWLRSKAFLTLGDLQLQAGDADRAVASFARGLESIEPHAGGSHHPRYREVWAQALLRLGRVEEARPIVAELHRRGFRRPDFVRLCVEKGVWPMS